jgi:DNA-binding transcriptional regulator YiaG
MNELEIKRFWAKANIGKPNDCWNWNGSKSNDGYGTVTSGNTTQYAHRIAYSLTCGSIPKGQLVCHHCDNRRCVNPNHLFLGTHQDNSDDMKAKQRSARGARHGTHTHPERFQSKLTDAQVAQIRAMRKQGIVQRTIAKLFGISPMHVSKIEHNKTRRELP